MTKLYQAIGSALNARHNCIAQSPDHDWIGKHEERLDDLASRLPHGSGFDTTPEIDLCSNGEDKIIIYGSYHAMNDGGYYDGWYDFTVKITPHMFLDFDLRLSFSGKLPMRHAGLREYIAEMYSFALAETVVE